MKKWLDNYNDSNVTLPEGFVGMGNNTKGRNYSPAWGGQFQYGGLLQPNDWRLPSAVATPNKADILSSELAQSIGGVDGEPAYLVPSFKGGRRVNSKEEFRKTGEYLGGPFKTWQEADKFDEIRHEYVEKGQSLPSPLKWWGEMAMGGSVPGAVGFTYARTQDPAPSNGKYAKKTLASAQNGKKFSMEDVKKNATSKKNPSSKEMSGAFSEGKKDSNFENVVEIIDPTGISSWDDVADSYRETGMSPQTALEVLGAVPLFGKASKLTQKGIHLTKYKGLDKALYKTLPKSAKLSKTLNASGKFGRGSDAYQAYDQKQNGGEMSFYQEGLDFTPKTISKNGSVIKDDMGQWAHPGEITEIDSNDITMEGVDYPVLGVSDTGDEQMMYPGEDYKFDGNSVTEYPILKKGGWLNKYK